MNDLHAATTRRLLAVLVFAVSANAAAQASDPLEGIFGGIEPIVHARTYYWDSQSTSGSKSEAWALGGWAGLKTRWYGDAVQFGALGYTSQKLYGPSDKGGSLLLASGQDPINVLGQAYGSVRLAGQTFTGYRQSIDQPWVNPQDNRMIPNLFEGYLLSGKVAGVNYIGGYVTKFKSRASDAFQWMSSAAGSSGPQQGLILFGAQLPFENGANLRVAEQYLIDTYNNAYVDGAYPISIGERDKLRLRAQYANQKSVGSDGLGAFDTWMYGLGAIYEHGPATIQIAWTQTSRDRQTLSPFGTNASYISLMQVDFNYADEKAWLVGGTLDLASLGAPGLRVVVNYANGHGGIDPSTGASLGSRNETDVKLAYAFDKSTNFNGLSFGVEGSWLNQAGAVAQGRQLRAFLNYEIPFGSR